MILGIGTDILDITRLDKTLKNFDKKFITKIYGKQEIDVMKTKFINLNLYLGKRFAAKEACWKALSPNRGDGIRFKEIETLNDLNGKPYINFSGKTKIYIKNKEKKLNRKLNFEISLSDEPPYVIAFVVIYLAPNV